MKAKFLIIGYIAFFTSCTFYYKTSDINQSLFDHVKSVNSNYQSINNGFKKIEDEYSKLKSDNKQEPFLTASKKISSLEKDLLIIADLKKSINNEYAAFKKYSKGKNKIASNSDEWNMVKKTKKNMKLLIKQISTNGEEFVKKTERFNHYLNEFIVPLVKVYKVSDFKERYIKTVANLKKLRSENLKLLNEHRLIYNDLEKKKDNSSKEVFIQLKSHLTVVSKKTKKLEFIERDIGGLLKAFNEKTKGKAEIYSTDPFWKVVQEDQQALKSKVNEIEKIQKEIKSEYSQFQKLAKTLITE